jgi:hypothetical protein
MKPTISTHDLIVVCSACPSSWDATDHLGRHVHIRYRWGNLRVQVSQDDNLPHTIAAIPHGNSLDGSMDEETMISLTSDVIKWVSHRIEFP